MTERIRIWEGLSTGKADGRACVICGRDYLTTRRAPAPRVPVGRALSTGSQVFACVGDCAGRAATRCYPGGAMALSGVALAKAATAVHSHAIRELTAPEDPLRVGEVVCEVVAAAAPLVIAAELRWLARMFETRANAARTQITNPTAALEGTDPAGQRCAALLECARLTRAHASAMDPTGDAS